MQNNFNWYKLAQGVGFKPYVLCLNEVVNGQFRPVPRSEWKDKRVMAVSEEQALFKFKEMYPIEWRWVERWEESGRKIRARVDDVAVNAEQMLEKAKLDSAQQQFSGDW